MPTLETLDGQAVDVTPVDPATINAQFQNAMDDDGDDTKAPPRRQPRTADADAPKARRGRPPKAEQARTTAKPAVSLDNAQRAAGVQGIAQIGAGFALMWGKATGNAAFEADAMVIAGAAPQLADAAVQIAATDPAFAARLDKVCSTGPWAALVAVGVNVTLQCVRNHKPGMSLPGTVHPDEILRNADDEAVRTAA